MQTMQTTQSAPQADPADRTPAFLDLGSATASPHDVDPLAAAVERHAAAALTVLRLADPQAWLFLERSRYLAEGTCDPYAELMLRRAGFLTGGGARVGPTEVPPQQ